MPSVVNQQSTPVELDSNSWSANLPTGLVVGNVLEMVVSANDAVTLDPLSGWDVRVNNSTGAGNAAVVIAHRIIDGTEGASVALGFSGNTAGMVDITQLSDWGGTLSSIDISAQADGTGTTVDPNAVTVSWPETGVLLRVVATARRGDRNITSFPTGYSDNQRALNTSSASGGASLASASRTEAGVLTTEDPDSFGLSSSTSSAAFVIAYRPANTTFGITDTTPAGPYEQDDTVNLSFANAVASKTYTLGGQAITPDTEDANGATITIPNLRTFGDRTLEYSTDLTLEVDSDGNTDSITIQINPETGFEVGTVSALDGYMSEPEFAAAGLVAGDEYYAPVIAGADHSVGSVEYLETEQVFSVWYRDITDGVWSSAPFVVTIPAESESALVENGANPFPAAIVIEPSASYDLKQHLIIPSGATPTYTLTANSDSLANGLSLSNDGVLSNAGDSASRFDLQIEFDPALIVDLVVRTAIVESLSVTVESSAVADSPATGTVSIFGSLIEGSLLTADTSTLADPDGIDVLTYQWLRDGSTITGAISSTYRTVAGDVGSDISVNVTLRDNDANLYPFSSPAVTISNAPSLSISTEFIDCYLRCSSTPEKIFITKNQANKSRVVLSYDEEPIDLTQFTSFEIYGLSDTPITSNGLIGPILVDSQGVIILDLQALTTEIEDPKMVLVAKNLSFPNGLVLIHPDYDEANVAIKVIN